MSVQSVSDRGSSSEGKTEASGMSNLSVGTRDGGLSDGAQQLVQRSWRSSTQRHYEIHLRRWREYCSRTEVDWMRAQPSDCANFLAELFEQGLGYSSINTARSAVSAVCARCNVYLLGLIPLYLEL